MKRTFSTNVNSNAVNFWLFYIEGSNRIIYAYSWPTKTANADVWKY